jgi:hypothetical protein
MNHENPDTTAPARRIAGEREGYQRPELTEFGTLRELTLSGSAPLSDSFGGAAGGGS